MIYIDKVLDTIIVIKIISTCVMTLFGRLVILYRFFTMPLTSDFDSRVHILLLKADYLCGLHTN